MSSWRHAPPRTSSRIADSNPTSDVAVVHPHMGKFGWSFYPPVRGEDGSYVELEAPDQVGAEDGIKAVVRDPVHDSKFLREIYFRIEKDYNGRWVA